MAASAEENKLVEFCKSEGISFESSDNLIKLCKGYKIPVDVLSELNWQVAYLRVFKKNILPNSLTETQRRKALGNIELLAGNLRRAIEGLTFVDRNALDNEFFGVDEPNFLKCFEFVGDARSFDLAGSLIPCIEAAAQKTQARFVGAGLAGAPKLTERQADFIRCIAGALKPAGITPSNSGKFLEFCNIIFEAAGFHDAPERAMKYFMKNLHPEMKVRGYSL